MKHIKKFVAIILTAILISTVALPIVSFAAENVPGDHTSFEDFWNGLTDDEGNVDWRLLPKALFKVYFWVRLFEAITESLRKLLGIQLPEQPAPEDPAPEVTTVEAEVAP